MFDGSSWLHRVDDRTLVVEWIEPWMKRAERQCEWQLMPRELRAIIAAWLLSVYSLRGGAICFFWHAPSWVLCDVYQALYELGDVDAAELWREAVGETDYAGDEDRDGLDLAEEGAAAALDTLIIESALDSRLIAWVRENADELPSPGESSSCLG